MGQIKTQACSICFPDGFRVSKYILRADDVVLTWPFPTPDTEETLPFPPAEVSIRRAALEKAHGVCAVCGTDYSLVLDGLGLHVLQVHHRKQGTQANTIEDLAIVCANCHQMIHSDKTNAMPVEELRKRLQASSRKR